MLRFFACLRFLSCFAGLSLATSLAWAQGATIDAPATAPSGSKVRVEWTGPVEDYDQVCVVPAGAPDTQTCGRFGSYTYGRSPVATGTPEPTGEYELRLIAGRSKVVRARRPLTITPVTATLDAPASIVGGQRLQVVFTGPRNQYDRIAIFPADTPDTSKPSKYAYTYSLEKVSVVTPEQPGEYEVRYVRGQSGTPLARAKLTITGAAASLHGPGTAVSGATISVAVTGPHGDYDKVAVFPAGAPENANPRRYSSYTYGRAKVKLRIPEQPGEYEIRYITGGSGKSLASEKLSITGTTASIEGPGEIPAGERFKVSWKGPGNQYDHIVVAPKGAPEDKWVASNYVYQRSPTQLRAPTALGQYELRYQTGETGTTLARDELEVVAAKQEPGLLQVAAAESTLSAEGAVEIILDASGSMLQRIGSERRIDIAKQTLTQLISKVIPAGTPFALRVFGREPKSCQSELDIPLRPLEVPAVAAKVASLEAKSSARTAIAASLEKVAADLGSVKGERLVILITDGEETCGGSPAQAIEKLRKNGVNLRVNIVGFAVDDAQLAATFRQWSLAGNGTYFDARDAAGLNEALASAVRTAFEVLDEQKSVVADGLTGGDPVPLMPGAYTVHLKGQKGASQSVTVRAKETARVQF